PKPDLVVVLTTAGDEVRRMLETELRGVDLIIGDPESGPTRLRQLDVGVARGLESRTPPLSALPIFGIGGVRVNLRARGERFVMARALIEPRQTSERMRPDPEIAAAVMRTR